MRRTALAATILAALAGPALAHTGHAGHGFAAGFSHPFTGLDHLLAMVAVGLWAGLTSRRAAWAWPAAFVGFMVVGFALGVNGGPLAAVEPLIAISVVALGAAVALQIKVPAAAGAALIAVFALAHGYAHGQELPAGASGLAFAGAFAAATVILHLAGLALAWALSRARASTAARVAGFGVAAAGLALAGLG